MLTSTVPVVIYLADKITNYFTSGIKNQLFKADDFYAAVLLN
jgi:hypothetical protein